MAYSVHKRLDNVRGRSEVEWLFRRIQFTDCSLFQARGYEDGLVLVKWWLLRPMPAICHMSTNQIAGFNQYTATHLCEALKTRIGLGEYFISFIYLIV